MIQPLHPFTCVPRDFPATRTGSWPSCYITCAGVTRRVLGARRPMSQWSMPLGERMREGGVVQATATTCADWMYDYTFAYFTLMCTMDRYTHMIHIHMYIICMLCIYVCSVNMYVGIYININIFLYTYILRRFHNLEPVYSYLVDGCSALLMGR